MKILRNTYLSLGSNLGEKLQNLQNAIYLIDEKIGSIKIVDFEKNKLEEKVRRKMMEKKGIKNMKVRFFD